MQETVGDAMTIFDGQPISALPCGPFHRLDAIDLKCIHALYRSRIAELEDGIHGVEIYFASWRYWTEVTVWVREDIIHMMLEFVTLESSPHHRFEYRVKSCIGQRGILGAIDDAAEYIYRQLQQI